MKNLKEKMLRTIYLDPFGDNIDFDKIKAGCVWIFREQRIIPRKYIISRERDNRILKNFAKELKKRNIISIYYICGHTIRDYQIKEHPEFEKMITREEDGTPAFQPLYLTEERYAGCLNNLFWIEHFKKETKEIIDLGFDGFVVDNVPWVRCFCRFCKNKFKKFVNDKNASIPAHPDWKNDLWQKYTLFLCNNIKDFINEVRDHLRKFNPSVVFGLQGSPPTLHPPSMRHLPTYFYYGVADWINIEHGLPACWNYNALKNSPLPCWNVEHNSYLSAEAKKLNKICEYAIGSVEKIKGKDTYRLGAAEALSFGLGYRNGDIKDYDEFIKEHCKYYTESDLFSDVGIYFSFNTLLYNISESQSRKFVEYNCKLYPLLNVSSAVSNYGYPSYKAFCNFLARYHVPFNTFLDLKDVDSRLLILPDARYLSDSEMKDIDNLKNRGVNILSTGMTGEYDKCFKRTKNIFEEYFGFEFNDKTITEHEENNFRIAHIPGNPETEYFISKNKSVGDKIFESIKWCLKDDFTIKVKTNSQNVLITLMKHKNTLLVNVVNYRVDSDGKIRKPFESLEIEVNKEIREVRLLSPDRNRQELKIHNKDNGFTNIIIKNIKIYSIIIIDNYFKK